MTKLVPLMIDGREVESPPGSTVIQAAEKLGIFIPRYCYHPGLSIAGNCRICLVDVEKSPKLQIACNTPVTEGMVVHTNNQKAEEGRKAVLEFLLANHPLDCPVCDQSGECDLQNFYMEFGRYDPRFREHKVKKKKAVALGPHVMLDQERCILCSRCVRFSDEISKTGEFGIFNRGDRAELGLYPGVVLDNNYSGNVIDICPVGALTERDFRFKARVWYLSSAPSVCNGCSRGCNIDVHFVLDRPHLNDGARILRLKPRTNPDVNQWWMCDVGRFGFHWIDRERLRKVRNRGAESNWPDALSTIATEFAQAARIGVLASTQLTNEELYLTRELFQGQLSGRVAAPPLNPSAPGDDFLLQEDRNPNGMGASLLGLSDLFESVLARELDALWVFGHDLTRHLDETKLKALSEKLRLFVFSGTNENPTAAYAHWVLPTAAYLEKDGTFVNKDGRVQRIHLAFPPLTDSRADWDVLLEVARRMSRPFSARKPKEIFRALAEEVEAFAGMSYDTLGLQGAPVTPA
jgi:NADH-quinone oxidoreductase subunit G